MRATARAQGARTPYAYAFAQPHRTRTMHARTPSNSAPIRTSRVRCCEIVGDRTRRDSIAHCSRARHRVRARLPSFAPRKRVRSRAREGVRSVARVDHMVASLRFACSAQSHHFCGCSNRRSRVQGHARLRSNPGTRAHVTSATHAYKYFYLRLSAECDASPLRTHNWPSSALTIDVGDVLGAFAE